MQKIYIFLKRKAKDTGKDAYYLIQENPGSSTSSAPIPAARQYTLCKAAGEGLVDPC